MYAHVLHNLGWYAPTFGFVLGRFHQFFLHEVEVQRQFSAVLAISPGISMIPFLKIGGSAGRQYLVARLLHR